MSPESGSLLAASRPVVVTVFPPLMSGGCGGNSCSCGANAGSPPAGLDPLQAFLQGLDDLRRGLDGRLDVQVAQYTTDGQLRWAIDKLNRALQASGSDYVVSPQNLAGVLTAAAPIVVVDNFIVAAGSVPDPDQFLDKIKRST